MISLTTDDLLLTTRSVRRRLDVTRPVELAVIEDCLRLALQAPTGGNQQNSRWLVISDVERRRAVAEIYRRAGKPAFAAAMSSQTDPLARRAYADAIYLADLVEQIPVLVIPCALGRPAELSNHRCASFYGSIIPAIWSFQLALRSRGLGSTYTTAHLRHEAEMADLLGIPADVSQIAMIPVAYTIGTDFRPAQRKTVAQVSYLDAWGSPWPR
jgi:nitroreductase